MAAPIMPYEGYRGLMASAMLGISSGANAAKIRLFANDYYPTKATSWTNFVEASFPGYAAIPTPSAADIGLSPTDVDVWLFGTATFLLTGTPGQVVYGYWIDWLNPILAARQVLWCQRFDSPFAFQVIGDKLPLMLAPGLSQG